MARAHNRIRDLRHRLGLSAEQFGQRVGLAQSQVSRLELGKQALTADLMIHIAVGLGIRPSQLLDDDEDGIPLIPTIGTLKGDGRLYEVQERTFVPFPATPGVDVAFETERGYLIGRRRTPRAEDDARLFVVHFKRGEALRLELRKFEKEGSGFSARTGAPVDRWLKLGDKRIEEVWLTTAEFRRLGSPQVIPMS